MIFFFDQLPVDYLYTLRVPEKHILRLKKYNINYIYQFLYTFPNRYAIYKKMFWNKDFTEDEDIAIIATLKSISTFKNILRAIFIDDNGTKFTVLWFNSLFLYKVLTTEKRYLLLGKRKDNCLMHPKVRTASTEADTIILSIYKGEVGEVYKNGFEILTALSQVITNTLDTSYDRLRYFFKIHYPVNENDIEEAKLFFAKERSFYYLAKFEQSKISRSFQLLDTRLLVTEFLLESNLKLTFDQQTSFDKIVQIACEGRSFDILLQGEVASGKTFVALAVALFFLFNGYKVIFVVPTVALFHQTINFFHNALRSVFEVKAFSKGANFDKTHIIVGTTNLLFGDDVIEDVGLIVIDEEQKFGVLQRKQMLSKCLLHNSLLLSATPIPRTLSLHQQDNMHNVFLTSKARSLNCEVLFLEDRSWLTKLKMLIKHEKVLCVTPRIAEDEYSAMNLYALFKDEHVYVVHGKMSLVQQQNVLFEFISRDTGLLICTSVFEVGINIVNLNTVFIMSANRFGLSQLHQIRGRVGRETGLGTCFFVISSTLSEETKDKLTLLCNIQEGSKVSELDFENRGGGDIYGTTQSGYFENIDISAGDIVQSMDISKRKETVKFLSSVFEK